MREEDKILLAVTRLSSALVNIDELDYLVRQGETKSYFGKMARDISKFGEFFTEHAREMTIAMAQTDEKYLLDSIYTKVGSYDAIVQGDGEDRQLHILFAKLLSSQELLATVSTKGGGFLRTKYFVEPLLRRLNNICKNAYLKKVGKSRSDFEKDLEFINQTIPVE